MPFTTDQIDRLREQYQQHGQGHVFDHFDDIGSEDQKQSFLKQLQDIPIGTVVPLVQTAMAPAATATATDTTTNNDIQPFAGPVGQYNELQTIAQSMGMQALAQNQVAALVLAGGQGTRLGFDGPKGMYDIGLPSHASLFELLVLRIRKVQQLAAASSKDSGEASVTIPFYIMTSPLNHDPTVQFFESNNYFGLSKQQVFFFQQGMLPCWNMDGTQMLLEGPDRIAMAPDGNGGIYPALAQSGALADMKSRQVQYLHVFSIDNALASPCDPVFMGYCIQQQADCGNKVVWKAHAHEKVGVVATKQGKPCIVEYSEITKEMAEQTDANGRLQFGAGNICNHFYTLEFIENVILPNMGDLYHVARKKIPYYDPSKKATVKPETENNGIKLETFIFDVFPFSKRMAVLDVDRTQEFAPVKNQPGSTSDSPDTARAMISNLAKQWVKDAGGQVDETGNEDSICEISPLTSYAGEGLEELVKGKVLKCPFTL